MSSLLTFNLEGEKRKTGTQQKFEQTPEQDLAHKNLKASQKNYEQQQFGSNSIQLAIDFLEQVEKYKKLNSTGFARINKKEFNRTLNSANAQIEIHKKRTLNSSQND